MRRATNARKFTTLPLTHEALKYLRKNKYFGPSAAHFWIFLRSGGSSGGRSRSEVKYRRVRGSNYCDHTVEVLLKYDRELKVKTNNMFNHLLGRGLLRSTPHHQLLRNTREQRNFLQIRTCTLRDSFLRKNCNHVSLHLFHRYARGSEKYLTSVDPVGPKDLSISQNTNMPNTCRGCFRNII